ncbi:replication protein [Shouchella clausii]|uniref:phage replisome organizer N-terminal domain-containing protein n=1 Tax=Shouchella clausii TaxID=79880 RepID=UPI000BA6BB98|nr:phage replisome organizer N-terminal domain-containing protein [Shouchella clausii]PAF13676.1 replication protein [Shouchella clausii]
MSDVKWIKLSTNMFEDEKIRLIEKMPEADTLLVIWIKLLSQAGKTNASGYIYLTENIPYTDEMLATIFDRPVSVIRMALSVFREFGMLEVNDRNIIAITNWEKHQNIDGMARIREQTRERVAKYREKKRIGSGNVTVTESNATDIEEELDKEIDKEDNIPFVEIIGYLNEKANKNFKYSTAKTKSVIRARWNEGFTLNDFKKVIDIKCAEWLNKQEMNKFLRPETLFGSKFEGYLNQNQTASNDSRNSVFDDLYRYAAEKDGVQ